MTRAQRMAVWFILWALWTMAALIVASMLYGCGSVDYGEFRSFTVAKDIGIKRAELHERKADGSTRTIIIEGSSTSNADVIRAVFEAGVQAGKTVRP
jgi:hypothetical protein